MARIAASSLVGIGINLVGLDPAKAPFWSAVISGVVAVPLMAIIILMAMRADVVGRFVLPRALWAMGWLCTGTMAVVVAITFVTWFGGQDAPPGIRTDQRRFRFSMPIRNDEAGAIASTEYMPNESEHNVPVGTHHHVTDALRGARDSPCPVR